MEAGNCTFTENKCEMNTFCPATEATGGHEQTCHPCGTFLMTGQGCNCKPNINTEHCLRCSYGICSECVPGYFLVEGVCTQPIDNCYWYYSATSCIRCKDGNAIYDSGPNNVTLCDPLNNTNKCSASFDYCPQDTFCPIAPSIVDSVLDCKACDDSILLGQGCNCEAKVKLTNCIECDTNGCAKCVIGSYLSKDKKTCPYCLAPCTACTGIDLCTECAPKSFLSGTKCLPCLKGCDSCKNTTTCDNCSEGYFNDGTICSKCQINCSECSGTNKCTKCKTNFILDQNICKPACSNSSQCGSQMFCDTSSKLCKPCGTSCLECSDVITCSKCQDGTFLGNSTCFSCEAKCEICQSLDVCEKCKPEFTTTLTGQCMKGCVGLENNNYCNDGVSTPCSPRMISECKCDISRFCQSCIPDGSKCLDCLTGYKKEGQLCTQCAEGYEPLGELCQLTRIPGSKLSTGAIVGIVIAIIIVVLGIGAGTAYYFIKQKKANNADVVTSRRNSNLQIQQI